MHEIPRHTSALIVGTGLSLCVSILGATPAASSERQHFIGICEPSGGAFIGATRFAVASDESNVIRLFDSNAESIVASVDLRNFTGHDKSDLEGAAARAGVVYWTASQSKSSGGKDKKRKIIFSTKVLQKDGALTLEPIGVVREDLKAKLVELSGSTDDTINIEGLAATPDGGLLFGLRNTVNGMATVVKLRNADFVLANKDNEADFGNVAKLDLGGRGIRSLEFINGRYLILAGDADDRGKLGFALFWWNGEPGDVPHVWPMQPDFAGMNPEVLMPLQDGTTLRIISDDGDNCSKVEEEDPPSDDRGFMSTDVSLSP